MRIAAASNGSCRQASSVCATRAAHRTGLIRGVTKGSSTASRFYRRDHAKTIARMNFVFNTLF
jgi:hypothetical protein